MNGGEARFLAQDLGGDLVGGDRVVKALAGFGIAIGAGQIESAAPVGFAGKLIRQILDNRNVFLVMTQTLEACRQNLVGAGRINIRIPGICGRPPAETEKHHAFRRRSGSRHSSVLEALRSEGL